MPEPLIQPDIEMRVRLVNSTKPSERVVFNTTPDFIETRNANYKSMDLIHAPGQIQSYQNTSSRNFNISQIRLISRTQEEATHNLRILHLLRGWMMPAFGSSTLTDQNRQIREQNNDFRDEVPNTQFIGEGQELRGAPPPVLLLSAYSDDTRRSQHINRIPVVMSNMSVPYPSDIDYVPTDTGVPMPTIMTLDMTLMETHAPNEYERFSLTAFKTGTLQGF